MIHVDVMDGHFVPNLTIGPPVIKSLRKYTSLPFDVHLMIDPVHKYIKDYSDAGADIITFHPEATENISETISLIKSLNKKVGISLNPDTEIVIAEKYLEKGIVEIAPLAYMRGRTLNNSFIIVDESQNTTKEQMKMILTRMGFGSYLLINGDLTQIDLPKNIESGLAHAVRVVNGTEDIGIINFDSKDIVRHPLVRKIIDAYKRFES